MKRHPYLWAGALISAIFFMVGALGRWQLPKINSYAMVKLESMTRDRLPLQVLVKSLEVSFLPIGAVLHDVSLKAKPGELSPVLESAHVDSLTVQISPWQLFRGRIYLQNLQLSGVQLIANVPAAAKKETGPPLDGLFALLRPLPINKITVEDAAVRLNLADPKLTAEISDLNVSVERVRGNALVVDLDSATIQVLSAGAGSATSLKIDLNVTAQVAREEIEVSSLDIRRGDSHAHVSGTLKGDVEALKFNDFKLTGSTDLLLNSMGAWASKMFPEKLGHLPLLDGHAVIQAEATRTAGAVPSIGFSLSTDGLKIGKFNLDHIQLEGHYKEVKTADGQNRVGQLSIPKISLNHPAGTADVENLQISFDQSRAFSGTLKTPGVQIHEVFAALGLPRIPVFAQVRGEFPCHGTLDVDHPELICQGKVHAENGLVRSSVEDKGTIVAIREISAEGDLSANQEQVTYRAQLNAPHSKGSSNGTIRYASGFQINYDADNLEMADIANLADLKFEGSAHLKGSTEGNADTATIDMNVETTDAWLEDYWLGNAKGLLIYRQGILSFSNVQGYYTVSRYSGDVKLNLPKKEVSANIRVPFFDAKDALHAFSHRVKLPFTVTGTGQAQVKVSGPLAFNHLSYDLKTSLYHGTIWNETFEQSNFDVRSVQGEVKAERVQILKGTKGGTITLTGEGHPNGLIQTNVVGRNLHLEDSAIISSMGLALAGVVDFDMAMSGPVLAPDTDFRGHLSKTLIGDQTAEDSNFRLKFNAHSLEGSGDLLGRQVKTNFIYPYDENAPFALMLDTHDWNFAPAFAAIVGTISRKDYEGHLTAKIDLKSANGGFWNSTGSIHADSFALIHGPVSLKSTAPIAMTVKSGQVHVERCELNGENAFLKVTESAHPSSKVDLQFNGKLDLTLLGLLTPFFEDMRGIGSFAFNLKSGSGSTDLLGSAYIEKGHLKFFDFVHPFEDVRIDMLFNQKKVLLNTVKAEFAGGRLSATGGLEFKGFKNNPVTLSGQFENVSLNLPDKVKTNGSGTFTLSGAWFPFTLKGTYDVKDGLVTKDASNDAADNTAVRRDQFLPQLLVKDQFVPLLLDIDVSFNRGLLVKNELIDGKVFGQLSVKGTPSKPSLLGQVTMEKDTKITVKDTQFDVTNANIQLTDPKEINPKLYIAARTRVQEYDVNLLVQGTGNKPELAFTSTPALSEKDIISLLALGTIDQQQANPAVQASAANTAASQQKANLNSSGPFKNNALSKEVKEKTGFDVQFAPGADESGFTQKIIIRKQFSNKLSVAASQSMGSRRESDAEIRYRLNNHLSSILSWENSDSLDTLDKNATNTTSQQQNQYGLDLEYKFEFK